MSITEEHYRRNKEMYNKVLVPVLTKKECWIQFLDGVISFVWAILFSPVEFLLVLRFAWGSQKHKTTVALLKDVFVHIYKGIWEISLKEPIFQLKRTYGWHRELVYSYEINKEYFKNT